MQKIIVEYLDAEPFTFVPQPKARDLTKGEASAMLNVIIERYAADHKVNYLEAVTALRDESPTLFMDWEKIK